MARTDARSGPQTRARISEVATRLFLERGFDAVTVAQVAREAGVSSVTVFKHFPRKEDLMLDRADDAAHLLRSAVRDRPAGAGVVAGLEEMAFRLADEEHGLSGVAAGSVPFFRTVAASPPLVARARELAAELQQVLRDELDGDSTFGGDSALLAAFFVAGYTSVLVGNARRIVDGEDPAEVAQDHRLRLAALFAALRNGCQE
jgi:AcrR family transcriptional regulator